MSSRIRSRSLCSRLSRQGFPCSWCGLGAVLLFVMAYPPVAETSSEEIPVLFSTTSQEHTPFTFLQESGQNLAVPAMLPFSRYLHSQLILRPERAADEKDLQDQLASPSLHEFAFKIDQALNNSSIVSLPNFSGLSLLFPGDAQFWLQQKAPMHCCPAYASIKSLT